jgi:hypothetical protein
MEPIFFHWVEVGKTIIIVYVVYIIKQKILRKYFNMQLFVGNVHINVQRFLNLNDIYPSLETCWPVYTLQ